MISTVIVMWSIDTSVCMFAVITSQEARDKRLEIHITVYYPSKTR